MQAIEISNNQLLYAERPIPIYTDSEVLIKVVAAGVNRPDIMQRKGLYPPPPNASDIPGLEIAGIVEGTGKKVTHLTIGDQVCALVTGGGYAEYCNAHETLCLPIPKGLNFIQAAALPETFFTVWSNLFDCAQLKPSETVLIHGGTSGIGTTAIQMAKALGSTVYTTAGSDKKCQHCESIGADLAINYKKSDFVSQIKHMTHQQGVDVILDIIGGDYFQKNINCLNIEGRLIILAVQNGAKTHVNLLPIFLKRLLVTGSTLRAREVEFKQKIAKQLIKKIWPLLEAGTIKPVINSTFSLKDAHQAHALMESSEHIGKIILTT